LLEFILLLKAKARVSVPILPTNMQIMMMTFPKEESSAVIPVERPTVENADTASKAMGIRPLSPSLMLRMKMAKKMAVDENKNMEKAL